MGREITLPDGTRAELHPARNGETVVLRDGTRVRFTLCEPKAAHEPKPTAASGGTRDEQGKDNKMPKEFTTGEVITTTESMIRLTAQRDKISFADAATKVFAEHPGTYALYDRALTQRQKHESPPAVPRERAPERRLTEAEAELNERIETLVAGGLDRTAATARVCAERPELYERASAQHKHRTSPVVV